MRDRDFTGIQALRGAAALLVVVFHAIEAFGRVRHIAWPNGAAGVDIFFVISGLVMTLSARRLGGGGQAWRRFALSRLRRIVPLYWLVSSAKIATVSVAPALALRTKLSVFYIAASLLFLPLHDASGAFKPLLPVGWTLTFEMLFYVLFAAGLKLRMSSPLWVIVPLVILVLLPHDPASVAGELCNPIVLEFAFGVAIGEALERGRGLSGLWAAPLLGVASAMILLDPIGGPGGRVVALGVPAAVIVAATVGLEARIGRLVPRVMRRLGDASYAIYLSHGFAIPVLALALPHAARAGGGPVLFGGWIVAVVLTSSMLGYAVHVGIEKPLLRAMSPVSAGRAFTGAVQRSLQAEATAPR